MVNSKNKHNDVEEFAEEIPSQKLPLIFADKNSKNNDIQVAKEDIENVEPIRDLSNDIYVNDIMLADGKPLNPDAEYIFK